MEKFLEYPLVKPLVALLRSRKFLVAVFTAVLSYAVGQYPDLAQYQDAILKLGLGVIAAIAIEDGAEKLNLTGKG